MSDSAHTAIRCDDGLIAKTAVEVVELLRGGEVSSHELLDVLERRISEVDPAVNALPTLCFDRARRQADRLVSLPVEDRGFLCGLPVPIKDLTDVAGVRTSHGSPIYADHVPQRSDILVERLESEGAVIYAKSNTPEFGAGAQTFNEVFSSYLPLDDPPGPFAARPSAGTSLVPQSYKSHALMASACASSLDV